MLGIPVQESKRTAAPTTDAASRTGRLSPRPACAVCGADRLSAGRVTPGVLEERGSRGPVPSPSRHFSFNTSAMAEPTASRGRSFPCVQPEPPIGLKYTSFRFLLS